MNHLKFLLFTIVSISTAPIMVLLMILAVLGLVADGIIQYADKQINKRLRTWAEKENNKTNHGIF